jgi:hypothetical protein
MLLEISTIIPFGPAGPLKLIVPVEGEPPSTIDGLTLTIASVGGRTTTLVDASWLLKFATIFAVSFRVTADELTVNVAEL